MTQTETEAAAPAFPAERHCPFSQPDVYLQWQRERPVRKVRLPSGTEAWLLTRHADVRAALDDPRLSADMNSPGFPILYQQAVESPLKGTFMRSDGEAHYRVRRMLNREFTVRRAESMRDLIEGIVGECLDRLAESGPPADLVELFALPVPSMTICALLGVPYEDHAVFQERTTTMINTKSSPEDVKAAAMAIHQYLDQLVAAKMKDPGDDLISRLLTAEVVPGNLDQRELVMISLLLLVGGHETTATQIALGTAYLLEHPRLLELLRQDPGLIDGAVEEMLRHQTIMQVPITRAVLEDIEIGGQQIKAGEGVLALLGAANRDEAAFPDPERFDAGRKARHHVAFSFGPHQCVGQGLARVELRIVFEQLLRRFPTLRLAVPMERVPLRPHTVGLFGVTELPVAW